MFSLVSSHPLGKLEERRRAELKEERNPRSLANSKQRNLIDRSLLIAALPTHMIWDRVSHVCGDEPGGDAVDPDAELAQLLGRRLGEADHTRLGRGVVRLACVTRASCIPKTLLVHFPGLEVNFQKYLLPTTLEMLMMDPFWMPPTSWRPQRSC